jgi:pimeloyl-ACP methyl ester carboxylesterase
MATASTPEGWMVRWGDGDGDGDGTDDAHSWEAACHLAAGIRDTLSAGDDGWWDDWAAILTPWGCDLAATHVPVRLWHGARDRGIPVVHGRWLAAHVPGLIAHISESEDHSNVEHNHKAEAYAWLSGLT